MIPSQRSALIDEILRHFAKPISGTYISYLSKSDEYLRDDGLLLHGAADVIERNMTLGVQQNVSEFLAVGDDSGGRLVVIRFTDDAATPYLIGSGALVPNMPPSLLKPLAESWDTWEQGGFPLPE
jgi:hypothetical protein